MTNQLDIRLERRDRDPLPPDALVKFQVINRGKDPRDNYRWVLYEDGRYHLARHSGQHENWRVPFDTPLPELPTGQLAPDQVAAVAAQLQQADFFAQPAYQADMTVEDGSFYVITARADDQVHEAIYEALTPPLAQFLEALILTWTSQKKI